MARHPLVTVLAGSSLSLLVAWPVHAPASARAPAEVLEKTEHGWTDAGSEEFVLELVERARRT